MPAQQPLEDAAHRRGAEQQRLLAAAQMQDAVGEDVTALEIAGELHLGKLMCPLLRCPLSRRAFRCGPRG